MARFMRAIHVLPLIKINLEKIISIQNNIQMKGGWIYIMTNRPNGTLYVGVTSNMAQRAWQHREGVIEGFTKRYGLKRLVYMEQHDDIESAIQRETRLKHWPRAWKVKLIHAANPDWDDLYQTLQG